MTPSDSDQPVPQGSPFMLPSDAPPNRAVVFIVDDDPAMRQSLRFLIESVDLAVRVFDTGEAFVRGYDPATPGCLVLDVRMPGISGLELFESLAAGGVAIPTLIITGYADVAMAVRAMKAGVVDFIEKPFSDQRLLDRIHQAIQIDAAARRARAALGPILRRLDQLTDRERQVLDLILVGQSNKQIGTSLGVSDKTVEVHRRHITDKMQAANVADLVRMVVTARLAARQTPNLPPLGVGVAGGDSVKPA